jgi:hypothetical protein
MMEVAKDVWGSVASPSRNRIWPAAATPHVRGNRKPLPHRRGCRRR